jgi:hypothetical protein
MKILRSKELAATVADRWEKQYSDQGILSDEDWKFAGVLDQLCALGPDPEPEDIERIIGNDSWTKTFCGECCGYSSTAVMFGEGYDSFALCETCLVLAITALNNSE